MVVASISDGIAYRARRVRALCALRRERRGRGHRHRGLRRAVAGGLSRAELASLLPAGAARNALDCALVGSRGEARGPERRVACRDRRAPSRAYRLHALARIARDDGRAGARGERLPPLKLKLGGDGDAERLAAVREAVPNARLIADANEAWQPAELESLLAAAARRRRRAGRATPPRR